MRKKRGNTKDKTQRSGTRKDRRNKRPSWRARRGARRPACNDRKPKPDMPEAIARERHKKQLAKALPELAKALNIPFADGDAALRCGRLKGPALCGRLNPPRGRPWFTFSVHAGVFAEVNCPRCIRKLRELQETGKLPRRRPAREDANALREELLRRLSDTHKALAKLFPKLAWPRYGEGPLVDVLEANRLADATDLGLDLL